jgi:hypothetical protein
VARVTSFGWCPELLYVAKLRHRLEDAGAAGVLTLVEP